METLVPKKLNTRFALLKGGGGGEPRSCGLHILHSNELRQNKRIGKLALTLQRKPQLFPLKGFPLIWLQRQQTSGLPKLRYLVIHPADLVGRCSLLWRRGATTPRTQATLNLYLTIVLGIRQRTGSEPVVHFKALSAE